MFELKDDLSFVPDYNQFFETSEVLKCIKRASEVINIVQYAYFRTKQILDAT